MSWHTPDAARRHRATNAATITIAALCGLTAALVPATPSSAATGGGAIVVQQRGPAGELVLDGCWQATDVATGEPGTPLCDVDDGTMDGTVRLPGLGEGDYTVRQTVEPDRFRAAADLAVHLRPDETRTVVSSHQPYPVLRVRTTSGGTSLPGSCWVLRPADQSEGGDQLCDADDGDDGTSSFVVRSPGDFLLLHSRVPEGFSLLDPVPVTVGNDDTTVTLELSTGTAPASLTAPSIVGNAEVGRTIQGDPGTWSGSPTSLSGSFLRCSASGDACTELVNDADHYTVATADVGSTLVYRVTAANGAGHAVAASAPVTVRVGPPTVLTVPTLSGTVRLSSTLTATQGTWTGSPSLAVRWQRCDSDPTTCTDIPGATGLTYRPDLPDAERRLRVVVTATNAAGSATAASAPTVPVDDAPIMGSGPSITGTPEVGRTLTGSSGSWLSAYGGATTTVSWLRCTTSGCQATGATGASYTLTEADAGFRLQIEVVATDRGGSTTARSALTGAVTVPGPVNTGAPTVTGRPYLFEKWTAGRGTWSTTGTVRTTYQWERCSATGCAPIAGATSAAYSTVKADGWATLRVRVTVTDATGTRSATSEVSAPIEVRRPVMVSPPSWTGTPQVGVRLVGSRGTWFSPTGTISYAYEWMRCNQELTRCDAIPGETGLDHVVTKADGGYRLRFRVDAKNSDGQTPVVSPASEKVVLRRPVPLTRPTISGAAHVHDELVGTPGTWSSDAGPVRFRYQWERCSTDGSVCEPIAGATSDRYTLTWHEVGSTIRLVVRGVNDESDAVAFSELTRVVVAYPPENVSLPTISGIAQVGSRLTAGVGTWTSQGGRIRYSYQWVRLDTGTNKGYHIDGATGSTYTPTRADVGFAIRVLVRATNDDGTTGRGSELTETVRPKA